MLTALAHSWLTVVVCLYTWSRHDNTNMTVSKTFSLVTQMFAAGQAVKAPEQRVDPDVQSDDQDWNKSGSDQETGNVLNEVWLNVKYGRVSEFMKVQTQIDFRFLTLESQLQLYMVPLNMNQLLHGSVISSWLRIICLLQLWRRL